SASETDSGGTRHDSRTALLLPTDVVLRVRTQPGQDARPAGSCVDVVRVGMAVRGVQAADAAVVAQERPLDVAAGLTERVGEDPCTVTYVGLHVLQVGRTWRPSPFVQGHDLHESDRSHGAASGRIEPGIFDE